MGENGGGEVSGGDSSAVFFWGSNALGEVKDLLGGPDDDTKFKPPGSGEVG